MKNPAHRDVLIDALRDAGNARRSDVIAVEEPLEIRLMRDGLPEADENGGTGRSISVTMRTPGHDAELAAGFLHGEGLLREARDIVGTGPCGPTGNILRVTVRADLPLDLARLTRNFYSTSSCGVCGKASIEAVAANAPVARHPARLAGGFRRDRRHARGRRLHAGRRTDRQPRGRGPS
jgi:FdhD protein